MRYAIYNNGELINTIESDASFVSAYCEKHGYTYEEAPLPAPEPDEPAEPAPETTDAELAAAILEGVNGV